MNETVTFWQAFGILSGAVAILAIIVWIIGALEQRFGTIVILCAAFLWLISCLALVAWAISTATP